MIAGRMTERLALMRPRTEQNQYGAWVTTWEDTRTVAAERERQTGSRSEEAGEHFADYRAEYLIRDAHPVAENWRVRETGGSLYTVTNIIPYPRRGMKRLVCVRVNE